MPFIRNRRSYNAGYTLGYEEGYEEGQDDGYGEGDRDGYARGRAEGLVQGRAEGYLKGEAKCQAARIEAYSEGYDDGCRRGREVGPLHVGDKVEHRSFGKGAVETIVSVGDDREIVVTFDDGRRRRLLESLASMEKIESERVDMDAYAEDMAAQMELDRRRGK